MSDYRCPACNLPLSTGFSCVNPYCGLTNPNPTDYVIERDSLRRELAKAKDELATIHAKYDALLVKATRTQADVDKYAAEGVIVAKELAALREKVLGCATAAGSLGNYAVARSLREAVRHE